MYGWFLVTELMAGNHADYENRRFVHVADT